MKWFYVDGKNSAGPLEESHLHFLVQRGELGPKTLVYGEGLAGWTPYAQVFQRQAQTAFGTGPARSQPPGHGSRREIAQGYVVGAGILVVQAVLLVIHGFQIWGRHSADPHSAQGVLVSYLGSKEATILIRLVGVASGLGYLTYGRKQGRALAFAAGLGLCLLPFFIRNNMVAILICGVLVVAPIVVRE